MGVQLPGSFQRLDSLGYFSRVLVGDAQACLSFRVAGIELESFFVLFGGFAPGLSGTCFRSFSKMPPNLRVGLRGLSNNRQWPSPHEEPCEQNQHDEIWIARQPQPKSHPMP